MVPSEPSARSWLSAWADAEARAPSASTPSRIRFIIVVMYMASGVQVDQLADVDREQELGEVAGFWEEVLLEPPEVAAGRLEIAAQIGRLAQQVERVLDRNAVVDRLGQREGRLALAQSEPVAAGLQVGVAEIDPHHGLELAGAGAPQHGQALVEQRVAVRMASLENPAVADVEQDLGARRRRIVRDQRAGLLVLLAGLVDEALGEQRVADQVVAGGEPVAALQLLGAAE